MSFVLDASVALSWIFEDGYSDYAAGVARVLDEQPALAPIVWPLEMANGLLIAVRRQRLQENEARGLLSTVLRLRIEIDTGLSLDTAGWSSFTVGLDHRLSAYDASYLELALRRGLPLATQDRRLADAAVEAGVELVQP
ncbi:MAG: type II toxin-antitoxin system VapC family toxin [Thermomicrobiales bacterium]|nr:type II toxin-antitoxin system VapC family toxin [Thermomicrobiales bacterium]